MIKHQQWQIKVGAKEGHPLGPISIFFFWEYSAKIWLNIGLLLSARQLDSTPSPISGNPRSASDQCDLLLTV